MKDQVIIDFLANQKSFYFNKQTKTRWIDQKCTYDVLETVSDCIFSVYSDTSKKSVTNKDIWHSNYAKEYVANIYKKPDVKSKKAQAEYNKFFMQPMELLAHAGILKKTKKSGTNHYRIVRPDILEYIAARETNSIKFLKGYIEKVLKDNNLWAAFEDFFNHQTKAKYEELLSKFTKYMLRHTRINGATEIHRIFAKVINPLAFCLNKKGTYRGRISNNILTIDMLLYNQPNFRDIAANKPKELTRKEHEKKAEYERRLKARKDYLIDKAKKYVKKHNLTYNFGNSEKDKDDNGKPGSETHHIFPLSTHPTFGDCYENLICITPDQHRIYAHPNGDYSKVDKNYQLLLLLAKSETIEKDHCQGIDDYNFDDFIKLLESCYNDSRFKAVGAYDFEEVRNIIKSIS